jgi:hypothetical protein
VPFGACGKSPLARLLKPDHFLDLEDPRDASRLGNPLLTLENLSGLIVIDEIQRMSELFPLLRVFADRQDARKARFATLGVQAPRSSEEERNPWLVASDSSISTVYAFPAPKSRLGNASGFGEPSRLRSPRRETRPAGHGAATLPAVFGKGICPPSVFHSPPEKSTASGPWSATLWPTVYFSEKGRTLGKSDTLVRRWLSILEGTMILRLLQPWFDNAGKRIAKNPKLLLNSGFFHFF